MFKKTKVTGMSESLTQELAQRDLAHFCVMLSTPHPPSTATTM